MVFSLAIGLDPFYMGCKDTESSVNKQMISGVVSVISPNYRKKMKKSDRLFEILLIFAPLKTEKERIINK